MTRISCVVEGVVDAELARQVVRAGGAEPERTIIKEGKAAVLRGLQGYAAASHFGHWFVLVDLDRDAECAPKARKGWLVGAPTGLCFRIAVHAAEAWLLADAEAATSFLGVRRQAIPDAPDELDDPKRALVDIARRSGRRAIREGIVPRPESGRIVGAGYTSLMIEFLVNDWDAWRAMVRSASLRRSVECVRRLVLQGGREL